MIVNRNNDRFYLLIVLYNLLYMILCYKLNIHKIIAIYETLNIIFDHIFGVHE